MKPRRKKPTALKMRGTLYILNDERETITRWVAESTEEVDPDTVRMMVEPIQKPKQE